MGIFYEHSGVCWGENWLGFWARYFINAPLLVIIHIILTQKWAAGFTEPAVTDDTGVCGEDMCINCIGFWARYFIDTTLLVRLYKCVKDIYGGGIHRTRRYVLGNTQ